MSFRRLNSICMDNVAEIIDKSLEKGELFLCNSISCNSAQTEKKVPLPREY